MKYYITKGQAATLHGDIEAARRCFETTPKGLNSIKVSHRQDAELTWPANSKAHKPLPHVHTIDLNNRFYKEARDRIRTYSSPSDTSEDPLHPIPDGDFELVLLGDDPNIGVKIRSDLPDLARKQLKVCLRENIDMFAWSTGEMPSLDSQVAFHRLTINPTCKYIVQRKMK